MIMARRSSRRRGRNRRGANRDTPSEAALPLVEEKSWTTSKKVQLLSSVSILALSSTNLHTPILKFGYTFSTVMMSEFLNYDIIKGVERAIPSNTKQFRVIKDTLSSGKKCMYSFAHYFRQGAHLVTMLTVSLYNISVNLNYLSRSLGNANTAEEVTLTISRYAIWIGTPAARVEELSQPWLSYLAVPKKERTYKNVAILSLGTIASASFLSGAFILSNSSSIEAKVGTALCFAFSKLSAVITKQIIYNEILEKGQEVGAEKASVKKELLAEVAVAAMGGIFSTASLSGDTKVSLVSSNLYSMFAPFLQCLKQSSTEKITIVLKKLNNKEELSDCDLEGVQYEAERLGEGCTLGMVPTSMADGVDGQEVRERDAGRSFFSP